MENRNDDLLKRLANVDISETGRTVPAASTEPASMVAHSRKKAIWWYNVLSQTLEYSETATSHQDRKAFSGPFDGSKGWIRGRVFKHADGKYYIVIYRGSIAVDSALGSESRILNLVSKNMQNLCSQIQDKMGKRTISYVVDEYWHDMSESKKKRV